MRGFLNKIRRRPTLPRSPPRSTIGAEELNFRVRNGNGCDLFAIATENLISTPSLTLPLEGESWVGEKYREIYQGPINSK
jgi:hypothetical protein